jgi:hypothetical protein
MWIACGFAQEKFKKVNPDYSDKNFPGLKTNWITAEGLFYVFFLTVRAFWKAILLPKQPTVSK